MIREMPLFISGAIPDDSCFVWRSERFFPLTDACISYKNMTTFLCQPLRACGGTDLRLTANARHIISGDIEGIIHVRFNLSLHQDALAKLYKSQPREIRIVECPEQSLKEA